MNILYLTFHGLSDISGVSKKILNQIDGLRVGGHQVSLCHYEIREDGHRVRMIDSSVLEDYGKNKLAPIKKRTCYGSVLQYAVRQRIDLVYVRSFHNANPFTIRLFRKLRQGGIKTVMEIPTFPYDQEYQHSPFTWKTELLVDKCFRKRLARSCYRIVTFSDLPTIFGQKTIRISNGVNFNTLPLKSTAPHTSTDLHLIAVAEVHYWHGYDRIIEGLGKYYRQENPTRVYLHIVGGLGIAEENLFQQLIQKYRLEAYITFYGQKQGEELNTLFDRCDFAIGSLGRHRSRIDKIKTLKNREYAARGIPFIYSETDEDFDQMPYILKAPADDSPIDIGEIIRFCQSLDIPASEIRQSVNELSWDKQMEKVIRETFS